MYNALLEICVLYCIRGDWDLPYLEFDVYRNEWGVSLFIPYMYMYTCISKVVHKGRASAVYMYRLYTNFEVFAILETQQWFPIICLALGKYSPTSPSHDQWAWQHATTIS